jgi:hypothetical protein
MLAFVGFRSGHRSDLRRYLGVTWGKLALAASSIPSAPHIAERLVGLASQV